MSVGYQITKPGLDNTVGQLARQVQTWTVQASGFSNFLDTQLDSDLEALGYSPSDVALLKSAAHDMNTLSQIYVGAIDHTPASPLNTFVERVAGIPLSGV